MKISGGFYFLVFAVVLAACSTLRPPGATSSDYSENITGLRPKYDKLDIPQKDTVKTTENQQVKVGPKRDVSKKLDGILDEIIKKNEEIEYTSGFTVQVYSGASRENADMVKSEIYKQLPTSRPKVAWEPPNYKVRVGSFLEKIEAQKSYSELKQHFPQAILIPTRIPNSFPISKY